ncbi:MAG TPA: molybdopterin cofactor-binding domain-containing protein [Casimicrobiaceae bacterium]|nr:molybdopterin cofactor-binding domain-containing protein [Casimicrobiaceae bacterium]
MSAESLKDYPDVDDWIAFEGDRVKVRTGKVDIGQRLSTALALIAAEELDVAYERVDVDDVDTASSLDEEYTSASNSIERCGESIRLAAATARRHLLALAARTLETPAERLRVDDGVVSVAGTSRCVSYWTLMHGRRFAVPVDLAVTPKRTDDYRVIGRKVTPLDLVDLVGGTAPFVHDLRLPGMLHARLVRPPHYHARVDAIDPAIGEALGSARLIRNGSFLAVVAYDEYAAIRAAAGAAECVHWKSSQHLDTTDIHELLLESPRISLPVRNGDAREEDAPELGPPPAEAVTTLHARITRPYLSHASIGPSAAAALLESESLTIWTHTQGAFPLRLTIAESLRIDPAKVRLIQQRGPGCYGHNGADDAALDAALIAREMPGCPVLLKYSREDEHAWEPYGPAMVVDVRASLGRDGRVIDWSHDSYSDTHRTRPRPGANQIGPARMLSTHLIEDPFPPFVPQPFLSASLAGVHRNADPLYTFPRRRIVKHLVRGMPLRTSTLRSLGAYTNVLAIESMMDALALAAEADPLEFRLRHLEDPRAHAVLEAVAQAARWRGRGSRTDGGRGLAFARYINQKAYAAVIADLRVDDAARVYVQKLWIAADAGQIVDHDGLRLQLEGGALQSLSFTLYERVTYGADGITSRDFDSYPILRFDAAPDIETILIDRVGEPYLGPSECTVGPTAAAIANALFDATGLRLHRVPFTPDAIRTAAMQ